MAQATPIAFLSYAREDLEAAREIYRHLTASGVSTWFDQESLKPGERWKEAIERSIRQSRYFIAVISSRSARKRGFVQTEIRRALEVLDRTPDDEVYLIPVRLDECRPPIARLDDLNWLDLFPDKTSALDKLVRFISPPLSSLAPTIHLDGVYRSQAVPNEGAAYWYCYRFYLDGTVIQASVIGEPHEVMRWFDKANPHVSVGRYAISGASISFSASSSRGRVDYEGEIVADSLILRVHSHINGYRAVQECRHVVLSGI